MKQPAKAASWLQLYHGRLRGGLVNLHLTACPPPAPDSLPVRVSQTGMATESVHVDFETFLVRSPLPGIGAQGLCPALLVHHSR